MPAIAIPLCRLKAMTACQVLGERGGSDGLRGELPAQAPSHVFVGRAVADQLFINGDALNVLRALPSDLVDVMVTSPPYNRNIRYASYHDARPQTEYLSWCGEWLSELRRILKEQGSLFLNVAGSPTQPHTPQEVLDQARQQGFTLQNDIGWVKSIHIPGAISKAELQRLLSASRRTLTVELAKLCRSEGHTFGHSRPINSERFLNRTNERIYHLTNGSTRLDRLAIGVPYADPTNAKRWKSGRDKRCLGDTWFIPYPTRTGQALHPAPFPVDVPMRCIRLHFGDRQGGLVLDPFGGSGTTALAALKTNHRSMSIEIDPGYHSAAVARLTHELAMKDAEPAA